MSFLNVILFFHLLIFIKIEFLKKYKTIQILFKFISVDILIVIFINLGCRLISGILGL